MKITVDLNKDELEALQILLRENPCSSGCVWQKCKGQGCYDCDFTKAQFSLRHMFHKKYITTKKEGE